MILFQNLELPSVAQNHATLLLDAALDKCAWDLARELVRFLRTIGKLNTLKIFEEHKMYHIAIRKMILLPFCQFFVTYKHFSII